MKKIILRLALGCCLAYLGTAPGFAQTSKPAQPNARAASTSLMTSRDRSFDSDWRFLRGDAPGAQDPSFDDSAWRTLDVPHDWSIEDLPPKSDELPQLPAVTGQWRFQKGDDASWSARDFDDKAWQNVMLPDNWEHHSDYTQDNVFGWYRRTITVPASFKGRDFDLLLGRIDDADETYFNGERIGGMGAFPPNFRSAYDAERRYRVAADKVRGDGTDTIAVRVFDGANKGGLVREGTATTRLGPFSPSESQNKHFTGNTVGGIGWYRKHFTLSESGKQVAVRFDGVYMNSEIWLNGQKLGEHPYGYTAFEFDLTPYLKPAGGQNVLAVKVRNEGRNSRWYSGSGIYRHVWLSVRNPLHVPNWGVFVTTPQVSRDKATVKVSVETRNQSAAPTAATARVRLLDAAGKVVGTGQTEVQLAPDQTQVSEQTIEVSAPQLWSVDAPNLYRAEVEIVADGVTSDALTTTFGIRKIEVDAQNGFRLNGEPMLLKGGCIHHDNGPLGAVAIDRAEERKVQLLKAQGYNALRSAHNPPSTALLEACDRLGMLMIDESFDQWHNSKENNAQDYHRFFEQWAERDTASMVRRDRNHPSVIMWSIGNEIPEQFRPEAVKTQKRLRDAVLLHDPTRPVTQAISTDWGEVFKNWGEPADRAFTHLDVAGYNYLPQFYEADHARHPDRVMMGTESYANEAFDYWKAAEDHAYFIGDFVWTAMDYFGESGLARSVLSNEPDSFFMPYPWFNAWSGDLDVAGFPKAQSFYRDVIWRQSPLEMSVSAPIPAGLSEEVSWWGYPNESQKWNWSGHEGEPLQVVVYSRGESVRLELNGVTIGEKPVSDATKLIAKFEVPYAAGELTAVALAGGKEIARKVLKTTGAATKIKLSADRAQIHASRDDLSYVTVEITDENGARVPDAQVIVHFSVEGAGELAAQGSGNPKAPASFRAPVCQTFEGRCIAILRPTGDAGTITLRAQADGLEAASVTVTTR